MSLRFDQNGKPAELNLGLQLKNSAAQSYRVSQPKRFLLFSYTPPKYSWSDFMTGHL